MARKKKEQPKETIQGTSEQLPVEVSTQGLPEEFVQEALIGLEEVENGETSLYVKRSTQNHTEESQNETSKKAMDELIALDQELELYTTKEAPTIALEEEYTETDTEVAITENVAVNESEEVLEGVLVEGVDYIQPGLDGAKVIITEVGEINITTSEGESRNFTLPDEEWVEPTTPEHFLFNVYNQPIPATLIVIREMKLQNLVDKVLYVANLGGDLFPQGIRLDSAPYICKVLLPTSLLEKYNNLEDKLVYDENKGYLDLVVKAANSPTFLKRLFKVGKKGAIISPGKMVTKVAGFAVSLKSLFPVEADGSVSVGVDKPIYSVDDLKAMKSESLKIVSSWYGLPWENSNQARILIRKAQEGK